jgi:NitT/TauT family transport system substrate-binding protein
MRTIVRTIQLTLAMSLVLALLPTLTISSQFRAAAQDVASPAPISCEVASPPAPSATSATPVSDYEPPTEGLTTVRMGFVPVSIFAPVFLALEKGYFAEEGLAVELEPFPGGADPVVLTASGQLDVAIGGAGPAFWNAIAQGLPITVIAPGHQEGNPVATPLMISTESCLSGEIMSVADLAGKRVSVNARGATEYWLNAALSTGGLTINDIDLQTLAFPDAVAALQSGAVDAAMVGEPLATRAEQDGIAIRLATDFPIYDVQPTQIFANDSWLEANPDAAEGLVTGYLRAARELMEGGFETAENLAIIEEYTGVPVDLVAASVKPVYAVDGLINLEGLSKLQTLFREQGQLEYDEDLDPASFVDMSYVMSANAELNPHQP